MVSLVFLFYNKFYNNIEPVSNANSVFIFLINLFCKLMFWILHNLGNYQAILWHSGNSFCKWFLWIMDLFFILCEFSLRIIFCVLISAILQQQPLQSTLINSNILPDIFFNIIVSDIFLKLKKCGSFFCKFCSQAFFFANCHSGQLFWKLSFITFFLQIVTVATATMDHSIATKKLRIFLQLSF